LIDQRWFIRKKNMHNRRWLILSLLLLSLVFVASAFINLTDPTEARYATIGRDMTISGNYITPMIWSSGRHVPYLGKPPLHFWMIAASVKIFGENEFAVRFPSFLSAFFLLILMYTILRRYLDPETVGMSVCILAASPLFFFYSGIVIVDMTLTLCVGAAVCCQIAVMNEKARSRRLAWSLAVFTALALGMLVKGPIAVVIFGFPVLLWSLWNKSSLAFRNHAWVPGLLLFTAICLPWFLMAEMHNPGFLKYFFIHENLLRYVSHHYGDLYGNGHERVYGTAFFYLILGCLPWFIWVGVLCVKKGLRSVAYGIWNNSSQRFLFLGAVGYVGFMCFARQLIAYYLLPVIPWVAVCLAACLRQFKIPASKVQSMAAILVVIYVAGLLIAAPSFNHRNSVKQIFRFAQDHNIAAPILFVRGTPFTAYFYGQNLIQIHESTGVDTSVSKRLNGQADYLYVFKDRYVKRLSSENLNRLSFLGQVGAYKLYREKPTQQSRLSRL